MTTGATPMLLKEKTQLGVLEFHKQCYNQLNQQWNLREQMRAIDLAYIREADATTVQARSKQSNKFGNSDKLQNLTVPVVMPQVESAVVYQSSVFLTGSPIFGVSGSPQYEDQALQLEAVIEENSVRGAWTRELMMTFRDGFKYNLSATEVCWDRLVTASLETDIAFGGGKQGKPKEVIWEGNTVKRWNLYNTFFDSRVDPTEMHKKGEFVGKTELYSRVALKAFFATLPDKITQNVVKAFESGLGATTAGNSGVGGIQSFYVPDLNPDAILNRNTRHSMDWMSWAGMQDTQSKIKYHNMYEVSTMYARIIPSDFGIIVPGSNTPQVWKFIIVNHSVVVYAERLTNAHGYIPVLFSQPLEDGLTYQTKSLANNVLPIQEISSSLMNSVIAARRRAISDRGLYDPSRVTEANINSANPSAKIPVRASAYGKPLSEAYYPIPFRDDQSPIIMQQLGMLGNFANNISGSNPAKQGQFVKGNKTKQEFDSVMSNANGRDQMTSILLEAQLFTPMKEILKLNTLQYQGGVSIYSPSQDKQVKIDPVALRKAVVEFKVSDGLTPTDKLMNEDVFMVALQQIGSSAQIAAEYNIAPLFSYLMKTQGADLKDFEKSPEQVAYEQAAQQWQQVVLQLAKANPNMDPSKYPPQPAPQAYGYVPGQVASNQPKEVQAAAEKP